MGALARIAFLALAAVALTAHAQSGLRLPERGEPGIDPSFARGWLAPDYDNFGFARSHWRGASGYVPGSRMSLSFSFSGRGSLGMGVVNGRDFLEQDRQVSLFGRYSLTQ